MKTTNQIKYWAVLFTAMTFAACTQDDAIAPSPAVPDADNALAQLPGNTPVRIITLLDGEEVDSRAGTETTYAENEIHEQGKMVAHLYIANDNTTSWGNDGKSVTENFTAGNHDDDGTNYVEFDGIEAISGLTLDKFPNKNEWTILWGDNEKSVFSLSDSICGWSQLAIHAISREPVLVYHMHRTRAKVTLKLTDVETNKAMCLYNGVYAAVYTEQTLSSVVKNGNNYELAIYNNPLKSTEHEWDAEYFPGSSLYLPYDVNGEQQTVLDNHADGEGLYELTGLVYASATHEYVLEDESTMVQGGTFNKLSDLNQETVNYDWDKTGKGKAYLSVEIEHGHDDLVNHPNYPHLGTHGGGVYRVNLEDITMSDGNKLKRLEAGKHYTITLGLRHNKLVGATATIGGWNEYSGTSTPTDDSKVTNP